MDFFKSSPPTEVLRIESEPPGADARTSQGQTCRTPCELTVQGGGELSVTLALAGYQPQTVSLRPDQADSVELAPEPGLRGTRGRAAAADRQEAQASRQEAEADQPPPPCSRAVGAGQRGISAASAAGGARAGRGSAISLRRRGSPGARPIVERRRRRSPPRHSRAGAGRSGRYPSEFPYTGAAGRTAVPGRLCIWTQ